MADLATTWAAYEPGPKAPWNLARVVRLHRRAGFAAPWPALQRDLEDGPGSAVSRLLAGKQSTAPDFGATADLLADDAVAAGSGARLGAWWFYRLLLGPDPLGERLTLLWHDHFATANSKVKDAGLMRGQNDALRRGARGRFGGLLTAMLRDPALLVYLDAPANRKGSPNENLARELLELFTLGVGHYTEADVKETARALTGWSAEDGRFQEQPANHDDGTKTILGRSGRWGGKDLPALLLGHPATADRLAWRLARAFLGERGPGPEALGLLARGLRERDLDVGWAVETILRSRLFHDAEDPRVATPVESVAGPVRALEMTDPAPSTVALAGWAARLGQELFEPPNVGGWPGGRAWLHPRAVIARANFAGAIVAGRDLGRPAPYSSAGLPRRYGFGSAATDVLTFHHRLLLGTDPTPEVRRRLGGLEGGRLVALLLSTPEAQLC